MTNKDFVIIGGSIAGFSAIKAIREEKNSSSVLWISNEDRLPYKRTKINKHISTNFEKDQFALTDNDWLIDNHIELLYDEIEHIDTNKKELTFEHRGSLKYKKLIICTGNQPNNLKINNVPDEMIFNVHKARQVENVIRISNKAYKFIVFGAGVEGIETAEQLSLLKKHVVIMDKGDRINSRFLTTKYSDLMKDNIKSKGIPVILNATKTIFTELDNKKYIQIHNNLYEFDAIISCIGSKPNITLAKNSSIDCNRGILVNEFLETSSPDIYAAGDVAEHKGNITTQLWHAAEKQGYIAGKNAYGQRISFKNDPFRMKTKIFNEFYFSVPPSPSLTYDIVTESKGNIVRDMYFNNGKIEALLMKDDEPRAKIYQQALMEHWTLEEIKSNIPLN